MQRSGLSGLSGLRSCLLLLLLLLISPLATAAAAAAPAAPAAAAVAEFNLTSRARHGRGLDFILRGTGVTRRQFFLEHYEKHPVFLPRNPRNDLGEGERRASPPAAADHYGDLFPFEAVAAIIDCFPDQRKLDDWVVVKEAFVTDGRYKKVTEYYAAYLRGETLGMFILNRLWATLGLLVDDLDADFGFPWRVNLYLTPRGAQGFMPHTDQHDFFILQTGGRKRWRVYGNPVPLNTRAQEQGKHGAHLDEAALGAPLLPYLQLQLVLDVLVAAKLLQFTLHHLGRQERVPMQVVGRKVEGGAWRVVGEIREECSTGRVGK